MKKLFRNGTDWVIFILLIFFSWTSWKISPYFQEPHKSLFINISAGFIGSLITIFVIEYLRNRRYEKRIVGAKNIAKEDIEHLRNSLTTYISNSFGIKVEQYIKVSEKGQVFSKENLDRAIKNISDDLVKRNILDILNNLEITQWRHLKDNLPQIKSDLTKKINLYKDVLPEEIISQLLIINKRFDSFYTLFGTFPELFIKEEKNWSPNKYGNSRNRSLRNMLLIDFAKYLEIYFKEVNKLIGLIAKY